LRCVAYRAVQSCESRYIDDEHMQQRCCAVRRVILAPMVRKERDMLLQRIKLVFT
jgi:hypothetical protein